MKRTRWIVLLTLMLVMLVGATACTNNMNNKINGLNDLTATCGDTVPELTATSTYGDIVYGLAKSVEGTAREDLTYGNYEGTLTAGTYYVKAIVAPTEDYNGATAYATITVKHQTFEQASGEVTDKHETTADGRFRTWSEKTCACGETVIGNDVTVDKKANAINGLQDVTVVCGDVLNVSGVTATYGTPTVGYAKAQGGNKEDLSYEKYEGQTLTHGTYYLKASVETGNDLDYKGATAYATVTVNHKAYDDIAREGTFVAPSGTVKGYYEKTCDCGEKVKDADEYVTAVIKLDGKVLSTQIVKVGDLLTPPTDLPTREGYTFFAMKDGQKFSFENLTVEDFVTYELSSKWIANLPTNGLSVGNSAKWLFISGPETGLTEEQAFKLLSEEKGLKIEMCYFTREITDGEGNVHTVDTNPLQVTIGTGALNIYSEYSFTVTSSQSTYIWFGDNFTDGKRYLITNEMENKPVKVSVRINGDNKVEVTFNDTVIVYDNWGQKELSGANLFVQDKRAENQTELFPKQGQRYTVQISEVTENYDYMAEAKAYYDAVPALSDITADNAFDVQEVIARFDEIASYFTVEELGALSIGDAVRNTVTDIVSSKVNIVNYIIKDLPAFSTVDTLSAEQLEEAYLTVAKYVAYVKTLFTSEDLATYEEPREISLYRFYFADRKVVMNKIVSGSKITSDDFVKSGNNYVCGTEEGSFDLPSFPLNAYTGDVKLFLSVRSGAPVTVSVTDGTNVSSFVINNGNGTWFEVRFTYNDGWYAAVLSPDGKLDGVVTIQVSQQILLGQKGLTVKCEGTASKTLESNPETLNGKFTAYDVSVAKVNYKYMTVGGEMMGSSYYLTGEELELPEIPSSYQDKVGTWTFEGWYVGDTKYENGSEVLGSMDIVAKYKVTEYKEYIVTYLDEDNETVITSQTYHYGDKLVLPEDPTKPDEDDKRYIFSGWFSDGTEYKDGDIVTSNVDLIALFNEITEPVKVTLTGLGTEDVVINNYYKGSTMVKPADPVREGYVFAGWFTEDGKEFDFNARLTGDTVIVAKWYIPHVEKSVIISADELKKTFAGNWGVIKTSDVGKGWLYDTDGEVEANRFIEAVKLGGEWRNQTWTMPKINFNIYKKVEFVMTNNSSFDELIVCGNTIDIASFGEKKHYLMQIKDGKFNVYGINSYAQPLFSFDLSSEILNGTQSIIVNFNCTNGELHISEVHGTTLYTDYLAEANTINDKFSTFCSAISSAASMTDEQKQGFFTYLNDFYLVRKHMTAYESEKTKLNGTAEYLLNGTGGLRTLEDSWFKALAYSELTFTELFAETAQNKTGVLVMNTAYLAFHKATTMDYYAYVSDGASGKTAYVTFPKLNYKALGMTFSFNVCRQGTSASTWISIDGKHDDSTKLGNNLQYCFVMSIYQNETDGEWYAYFFADRKNVSQGTDYNYRCKLTEAQANGTEALAFEVAIESAAWYRFFISDVYATY